MEGKVLWEQDDVAGASAQLVLTKESRLTPEYELVVDPGDGKYGRAYPVALERAHLAGLWLAILEQADSLEWASTALIQEAAIRCVMKVRTCSREDATKLIKGEKL
jgi:hypothetical protein